jgi:nicotinamide mononucleotide adenylyltransferase/predicted nucleic acid-binding Zn ribbon protein
MNSVLTSHKKVRIVALGCGASLPIVLIREGSSEWNYKIELPYAMEEIDAMSVSTDSKYVSVERATTILQGLPMVSNVVDVVVTAKLRTSGERAGREHKFCWVCSNPIGQQRFVQSGEVTLPDESRQDQETFITKFVLGLLEDIKRQDTILVYSGSFNPMHAGHIENVRFVTEKKLSTRPVSFEISTQHTSKDEVDDKTINDRFVAIKNMLKDSGFDANFLTSPHALFWEKHLWLNANIANKDFVFLVGDDIWSRHGESLKADFGWEGSGGIFSKKGVPNAQFLIFNRGVIRDENEIEEHPAIHPLSWQNTPPDEILKMSSTEIRKGKTKK